MKTQRVKHTSKLLVQSIEKSRLLLNYKININWSNITIKKNLIQY